MVYYASHDQYLEPEDDAPAPKHRQCDHCGAFLPRHYNHIRQTPDYVDYQYDKQGNVISATDSGHPYFVLEWQCKRCGWVDDQIDAGQGCDRCGAFWRVENGEIVTTHTATCWVTQTKEAKA